MNANKDHFLKRASYLLAFSICLTFVAAADAAAHTVDFRPGFVEVHHLSGRARPLPGWLRRNREFAHWYWHSRHRFQRHVSWHTLYHLYLRELRHRRHARLVYDDHHYARGYRSYYKKWRKRNY